jgi:selenide,water dikinase
MQQSNRAAVPVLRAHGVRACTDVTGFGLLGHLREMLGEDGLCVRLRGDALPALPGARECFERGWRSTLAASNAAALARIERGDAEVDALLTDPQTAGGLLAAIPGERADACVAALRAAGYAEAAIVGHVELRPGAATIRLD